MLWLRGLVSTVLVPAVIGGYRPRLIGPAAHPRGGFWNFGWLPIIAGTLIYAVCLLRFLSAGGTPAIFFTRPLRLLIGEEPSALVSAGLYRFTRNPMYTGVLMVIFGQAILFASASIAGYGLCVFACFHVVVVGLEEPHLRESRGEAYERYCGSVPRWLGLPK